MDSRSISGRRYRVGFTLKAASGLDRKRNAGFYLILNASVAPYSPELYRMSLAHGVSRTLFPCNL